LRSRGDQAQLTGGSLFVSLPRLLLALQRFFPLPEGRFLLVTRSVLTLFLLVLAQSTLFFLSRALLIRAFSSDKPHSVRGIMPALLAKVARFWNVSSADPAPAWRTSRLQGEDNSACGDNQGQERGANPQAGRP
jgi:hypothetical protein